jgi:transposase
MKRMIRRHLDVLKRHEKKLNERIDALIASDDAMRRKRDVMESVPGVGKQTSATLIASLPELGEAGRGEIARLIGVAPTNRDSGTMRGRRTTGGGRSAVRTALYMPTIVAKRYNPVIRQRYEHLVAAGKSGTCAIIACMRKLIIILNAMIRDDITVGETPLRIIDSPRQSLPAG